MEIIIGNPNPMVDNTNLFTLKLLALDLSLNFGIY